MKPAISLFLFIILIGFSSAIKISPTQQQLIINQYETNCTNIWVLPQDNYSINSQWSFNGKGNLENYTLSSEKIRLSIEYRYLSEGKYEFCFNPSRAGNFSGIIYFYSENKMIEIGSWIELRVIDKNPLERISLITGNAIKHYNVNTTNVGLGAILILLIIVLILVFMRLFISKNEHT